MNDEKEIKMESKLYIAHYGILGQKWGKRNGPPYPLSGQQMSSSERKATRGPQQRRNDSSDSTNPWFKASIKGGKDKPNISPAEKIAKETKNSVESLEQIANTVSNRKGRTSSEKARSMSDAELRAAINRIEMERRYDSLTSADTASGWDVARDVLSVAGSTLAIAVSALAIVSTIKTIKGGGNG